MNYLVTKMLKEQLFKLNFKEEIVNIKDLDYFFTNSISRASKTMSECRQIKQNSKKTGTDNL